MSEPFYVSRSTLEKVSSLHRRARLESGETFDMGAHGPAVAFYRLSPGRELRCRWTGSSRRPRVDWPAPSTARWKCSR